MLPNEKDGVDAVVVPPVDAPVDAVVPAPPKSDGLALPPLAPVPAVANEKGLEAGCEDPDVVWFPPKSPPAGLFVAVLLDALPKSVDVPELEPAPKSVELADVLEPEFAVLVAPPKRDGVAAELAAPNRGLFGVLLPLPLFEKLNDIVCESMCLLGKLQSRLQVEVMW